MMLVALILLTGTTYGKIYDRCELARELKFVHKAPSHQLATWVCIAEHESLYNTSIVGHLNGDGSGDHGIFQISDQYWCSPPGKGYGCGVACAELEDDDISDDFICAQRIYKEHKQLSGNGFNAWAVYQPLCSGSKADRYIRDCFNDSEEPKTFTAPSSAFAHGFFNTAAGKASSEFSTTTEKSVSPFRSPTFQNVFLLVQKPKASLFPAPKSPFFPDAFFTSTEPPSFGFFFTSTTPSTPKQATSTETTLSSTTLGPTAKNLAFFQPTDATIPAFGSESFIDDFGKTSSPSVFLTSTLNLPAYQSSTAVTYPAPVFIVNGVKWQ